MEDFKKLIKTNKVCLGAEETIKHLKRGELNKVFVTSNCQQQLVDDISYYAGLGEVEVVVLDIPNDELGILCKKPFAISVLGVKKA
ncbi:TPA: 50S ribosomal protein L30 [Candidatus Woesearchaeota archaeon]|nr:50S ribosomal protein L30 [Candidatus Woesearchaeota archaeon]HII88439.1 50S ribosomal protein L30 [Candidatus Woesearchaeota archaeon]